MKKPQKKPVSRKKTSKKQSHVKTDALKAFQLVCILIAVSICISFAVILIYNNSNNLLSDNNIAEEYEQVEQDEPFIVSENTLNEEIKPESGIRETNVTDSAPASVLPSPASVQEPPVTRANTSTETVIRPPVQETSRRAEHMGNIAFVIDDAGNNLAELEPFLRIEGPLTIAVLPGLPHSAEAARRIRAAGKEVILHQPMEAIGGQNPGPSAIYSNMSADEIRAVLEKNIEEVGPVAGINNHQGSKITMDREIMEVILSFCAENNIYFLDSRTTAETAAPAVARRLGIKIAERDTFLDNEQDKESMQRYLTSGLARAQRNGTSIMIGHTHSRALASLLQEQYPILTIQGYTIKTVSDILR